MMMASRSCCYVATVQPVAKIRRNLLIFGPVLRRPVSESRSVLVIISRSSPFSSVLASPLRLICFAEDMTQSGGARHGKNNQDTPWTSKSAKMLQYVFLRGFEGNLRGSRGTCKRNVNSPAGRNEWQSQMES